MVFGINSVAAVVAAVVVSGNMVLSVAWAMLRSVEPGGSIMASKSSLFVRLQKDEINFQMEHHRPCIRKPT